MFTKAISSLASAESALKDELDALWVPYNPSDGSGGVHWHAARASILQSAINDIAGLRRVLEKHQVPIDQEAAAAAAEQSAAAEAST